MFLSDAQLGELKAFAVPTLQGQAHRRQRVAVQAALGPQLLNYALERQILVVGRGKMGLPHPSQQFSNARCPAEIHAHDPGIDEKAD